LHFKAGSAECLWLDSEREQFDRSAQTTTLGNDSDDCVEGRKGVLRDRKSRRPHNNKHGTAGNLECCRLSNEPQAGYRRAEIAPSVDAGRNSMGAAWAQ